MAELNPAYRELEFIGEGKSFQSFVDSQHTTVYKFSRSTYEIEVAREMADTTRREYELLVRHLGAAVVDTEVSIVAAPNLKWSVIQLQPFIEGVSVSSYVSSGQPDQDVAEKVVEVYQKSIQMRRLTSHMPDLWGRPNGVPRPLDSNNLLLTSSEEGITPVLVDTNFGAKQRNVKTRTAINAVQAISLGLASRRLARLAGLRA